tara:strand:- start:869 stop:2182 length:1314 start_codon:yes stop_codon:yes gene_type:complete
MSASEASLYEEMILESNDRSKTVDLKLGTISFDYYENLFSPTITAKVRVFNTGDTVAVEGEKERQSIYNGLPLRGGERLSFKILDHGKTGKGDEKKGLDFTDPTQNLIVSSIVDVISENQRESFQLNLVSREAITNETSRVFKKYSAKISASVETILTDPRIGFKLDKSKYDIDPTTNDYKFLGNLRKPFTVLVWLAAKSVPDKSEDKTAGFLFFQTQDGFKFKSIDSLTKQDSKATYTYTEINESSIGKNNDFNILNYSVDKNQNLLEQLRLGTFASVRFTFDPIDFEMKQRPFKFDEAGIDKLGNKIILPNISEESEKTLSDIPSRAFSSVIDRGTLDPDVSKSENSDPTKNLAQAAMRYNTLTSQLLSITVPCNTDLRAGDIITCKFPKISREDSERFDSETSGKYMIRELCHHFDPDRSFTSMKLVRDSFGEA